MYALCSSDDRMKYRIADNLILQIYGIVLLIFTVNTWFSISGLVIIPALWIAALSAVIVYNRKKKIALFSFEWNIGLWSSLFFPKFSDPVVTNIGKIHWLILCILALFGVDSLVTPIHDISNVSNFGKKCWVLSFIVAILLSEVLIKYRQDKNILKA
jgi:hypothetical protein